MKRDDSNGRLPASWHGRRGLWRLLLLALIVAGIGRVACARPAAAALPAHRAAMIDPATTLRGD